MYEEYLISLALTRLSSDKSAVNKKQIRLVFVNRALANLIEINPFYTPCPSAPGGYPIYSGDLN